MREQQTLIVDSREKWTQSGSEDGHIRDWLYRHGIPFKVMKLDVGDYMFHGGTVAVDRKKDLDEISHNLLNRKDSVRFWNEVRLAYRMGLKLVVLCEHSRRVKTFEDVAKWKSRYSGISGRRLVDAMIRCEMAYGVRFVFCGKDTAAKHIIEILDGTYILGGKAKL